MDKFKFLLEEKGVEYLLYKPSFFRLYASCYSDEDKPPYFSRAIHMIRMLRELVFSKYYIVYLKANGKIIGHIVVGRGGTRIAVSTKNDIVLGPIWIVPCERGKGIASTAIFHILHSLDFSYRYAYEFIEDNNIASIRTVEKNGYLFIGFGKECGLLKTIRLDDRGTWKVYRYGE